MQKILTVILALGCFLLSGGLAFAGVLPPTRVVTTGGGYTVECQDFGLDMRGQTVRSCLLAKTSELPVTASEKVSCAAKYAAAFRSDGRVEYCTLSQDAPLRRTASDAVACKAAGRVVFHGNGTVEEAVLKDAMELPYAKNAAVVCRGGFPVAFQTNGNMASCILDTETAFESGKKKTLRTACKAGGLIAFDEDGRFNGCYPPPLPKPTQSKGAASQEANQDQTGPSTQGGQTK